jgi:hypothetical protein
VVTGDRCHWTNGSTALASMVAGILAEFLRGVDIVPLLLRTSAHARHRTSRLRLQALHRFRGLRPDFERLGTPLPTRNGRLSNDAAGFASCYGPHRRSP